MRVVVAVDSFKGSVSSIEAGEAVREGILLAKPDADVKVLALADGGEGTVDALVRGMQGRYEEVLVSAPLGGKVSCKYGIIGSGDTAVIEMAGASGITLVKKEDLNPLKATSYGTGEVIKDAIAKGCRKFIIGIGGSATNDGGVGMLQALGFRFLNASGSEIGAGGGELGSIAAIDCKNVMPELKNCSFKIACDVNNPLCGSLGASAIYGPQKGATPELVSVLDAGLSNLADVVNKTFGSDKRNFPGAGAAGGMGFGFIAFLNSTLESGIEIVLDEINFDSIVQESDLVVTGEGSIDAQTAMGKAPVGVARRGKKHGAKVLAIAGCVTEDAVKCNEEGIDGIFCIANKAMCLNEAMENSTARKNITALVRQIISFTYGN